MPFDGGEFSQVLGPWPPTPTLVGPRRTAAAWLRGVFRRDAATEEARASLPGYPGCAVEPSVVRLLQEARVLIATEGAWAQRAYRTPDNRHCAVGALRGAARTGQHERRAKRDAHAFLLAAAKERGFGSVELMNDASTHAQILAAFDDAAVRAEDRPSAAG